MKRIEMRYCNLNSIPIYLFFYLIQIVNLSYVLGRNIPSRESESPKFKVGGIDFPPTIATGDLVPVRYKYEFICYFFIECIIYIYIYIKF